MTDVFISYAREDRPFVQRLHDALASEGRQSWVDWEGIPASAKWMAEVRAAIDEADCFCFVVSPDSVESPVCREEAAHAAASNKRILPLLHREVPDGLVPETVAAHNWIEFDGTGGFDEAFATLVRALETEPEHLRTHTRLLVRAKEWEAAGRARSSLLRGQDLSQAEAWLSEAEGKEPAPTQLHTAYVLASRKAASRRQRTVVGAVAVALVVSLILATVAVIQRGEAVDQRDAAERQAQVSLSRELAAASTAQLSVDPELSMLLAIESAETAPTAEASDALRDSLIASRHTGTLVGHANPILDARFSDDGTRVLTTSSFAKGYVPGGDQGDHSVRVWDTETGEQLAEIPATAATMAEAAFAPGGGSVLVSDAESPAIWDAETGSLIRTLDRLDPGVARFDATGAEVVGTCGDGLCIVDSGDGNVVTRFASVGGTIRDMAFAPDGGSVIAVSDRRAFVFDAGTGELAHDISPPFEIAWMSLTGRGDEVLLASERDVGVWTLASGEPVRMWDTGADVDAYRFPVEPAINADGSRVATMNGGGTITVWNVRTGAPVTALPASSVPDVEFSPDGERLLTVSEDHTAVLWDAERGRAIAEFLGAPGHLWLGRFSPDGSRVITAGSDLAAWLWVVDPGAPLEIYTAKPGGDGQAAAFTLDGSALLTGGYAGLVRMWDLASGEIVRTYTGIEPTDERYEDWIWSVAMSPDGSQVAASTSVRTIILWDAASGEEQATLSFEAGEGPGAAGVTSSLDGVTWAVAYSPDGSMLATASQDGVARLWDPRDGSLLAKLTEHEAAVDYVAFSPDGTQLLTGSDDGTAKVWDVATRTSLMTLEGQPQGVTSVAWSPDGRLLATTSYDGTIHLRDAATGDTIHVLTGSLGVVQAANFSPDSQWLATLSDEDGALRVWDSETGRLADIHQGTLGSLGFSVDFSPDGELIAVPGFTGPFGSGTPETLIYRCDLCTDLEGLLALAEERVTRSLTPAEEERFLHRS